MIGMQKLELKQQFEEIVNALSESKLKVVIDFASYLRDREMSEELLRIQMNSTAYQDWISSDNDIYDEVFRDDFTQKEGDDSNRRLPEIICRSRNGQLE
jgi:hypothetical protein